MATSKNIWVIPELNTPVAPPGLSAGLLNEAFDIAGKIDGTITAILPGHTGESFSDILQAYGVARAVVFKHPLLEYPSGEIYAAALADRIKSERPWLCLIGNTITGQELAPRLAVLVDAAVITKCVKIDLDNPDQPRFFRSVWGGQSYREITFRSAGIRLITMDLSALNIPVRKAQSASSQTDLKGRPGTPDSGARRFGPPLVEVIEPDFSGLQPRIRHLEYSPVNSRDIDVADAGLIVSAGLGATGEDIWPLVNELADLLEGAIGATRPVMDEGIVPRERMIGQTGKVVSPDLYLALGISGASHHTGGIRDSGTVISINRDPQAPIFQNSDLAAVADLKEILPKLVEKIKKEKQK